MKALVTGATGFIGSHVVRNLLKNGFQVRILKRRPGGEEDPGVEIAMGDLTLPDGVNRAVRGVDVVFHVAGHVSFWNRNNEAQNRVNIDGTRNVVRACLEHKVRRLVHTSSIAAIGFAPFGEAGDETLAYNWGPFNINYNNSKQRAEEEVQKGIREGLDAIILNPAVVFGAGDLNFHAGAIVAQMARGKIPFYFDGGCCTCDVEDVAGAHLSALEKGKKGERYILGGKNYSWKELFETIAGVLGVPPPKRKIPTFLLRSLATLLYLKGQIGGRRPPITPESIRVSAIPCFYRSDKAERELGYRITPFEKTIEKTYRWYKVNGYL